MSTVTSDMESSSAVNSSPARLLNLFTTPAAKIPCPFADEINKRLHAAVLSRSESEMKGLAYKSETGGNLTDWDDPDVDRLTSWVLSMARTFVETVRGQPLHESVGADSREDVHVTATRCWASIYRGGDHHPAHYHPNTAISAIYHVCAAGPCELELADPRVNVDFYDPGITFANEGQRVRVNCRPGILLLLPGWMKHSVPAYHGQDTRISIAWNLAYTFSSAVNLRPAGD